MDLKETISHVKKSRADIDDVLAGVRQTQASGYGGREHAIAVTKLQEATMWLGMVLKSIADHNPGVLANPYPTSRDPSVTTIEPTADNLKL